MRARARARGAERARAPINSCHVLLLLVVPLGRRLEVDDDEPQRRRANASRNCAAGASPCARPASWRHESRFSALSGEAPKSGGGQEGQLLRRGARCSLRAQTPERGQTRVRAARREAVLEDLWGAKLYRRGQADDPARQRLILEFLRRVAVQARGRVGLTKVKGVRHGQRMPLPRLSSGDDDLGRHERHVVHFCVAGRDRANDVVVRLRPLEEIDVLSREPHGVLRRYRDDSVVIHGNHEGCRSRIQHSSTGMGRTPVPLSGIRSLARLRRPGCRLSRPRRVPRAEGRGSFRVAARVRSPRFGR